MMRLELTLLLVKYHFTNVNPQCTARGGSHNLWFHSMLFNFRKCYPSEFATHYKFTTSVGDEIAVVFYAEPMANTLSEINSIQSDETFYTVPSQFYQLWTIYVNIDRYTNRSNTLPYNVQKSGIDICQLCKEYRFHCPVPRECYIENVNQHFIIPS